MREAFALFPHRVISYRVLLILTLTNSRHRKNLEAKRTAKSKSARPRHSGRKYRGRAIASAPACEFHGSGFIMNGMEPLWIASDQAKRLAELTAGTADPDKETPLRRDVRSLGVLLGRVLVEQGGEELLEIVEQLRHLLIQRREEPPGSAAQDELMTQARDIIGKMDLKDAHRGTKAFAI
jgi:hypothetical protein